MRRVCRYARGMTPLAIVAAAVAVLVVVYALLQFRRRKYAVRFTNMALLDQVAPKRPGWRRHVPAIVFLMAVSALVVGFAQPARDTKVPRERATIMMAIDTSLIGSAPGRSDIAPPARPDAPRPRSQARHSR